MDAKAVAGIASRAQAAADIYRLPLQHRVWRGQVGDMQGSGAGSSLDFQDHRSYLPGDDPRHINWQAYARTGNYSMKLYREEVRPMVDLVLDVSDSMDFDEAKRARVLELFYLSVHAAIKSGATLHTYLVKGSSHLRVQEDAIHHHAWLTEAANLPATGPAAPADLRALPFRAQSMRLFVSDLLFSGSPDPVLGALTRGRGRGIILCPFLQSEAAPEWDGNYEFVEAEAGTRHHHRVERSILKRYLEAYRRHFELWKTLGRKYDVILARIPSAPPLQKALQLEALSMGALEVWT